MFWKPSVLEKKQKEIKIFPLLQNWRLFQKNLQFYVTKNQNRSKTEQKEIKGPRKWIFLRVRSRCFDQVGRETMYNGME